MNKEDVVSKLLKNLEGKKNSSNIQDLSKILHNMCLHSLLPRLGSFKNITNADLCIIYHLTKKLLLNLNHLIVLYTVRAATKKKISSTFPYGMLLTLIFKDFKMPYKDEESI
jgi:hypothetical protein